jgi:hypothetical protein
MSATARKRIRDAARKRWAAVRASQGSAKPATVKRRKRRLTPEGRQRFIEATKRRWAAKRAANAAARGEAFAEDRLTEAPDHAVAIKKR